MASLMHESHLFFGQCVARRYNVFQVLRYAKAFSLFKTYDLFENELAYLFCFSPDLHQMFPSLSTQLKEQTIRMQQLQHPFLLNLISSGEEQDLFFFVEECPSGNTLASAIKAKKTENRLFPVEQALGICWLLCQAMENVHRITIHGFLNPLDIYLEPWLKGPLPFYPKIAHTGICLSLRATPADFLGIDEELISYAAPEFKTASTLNKQLDVYSLGALLYSLLTLQTPTGCFIRPSKIHPGLPKTLDDVLFHAMEDDPLERYASPGAFAAALKELQGLEIYWEILQDAIDDWLNSEKKEDRPVPPPLPQVPQVQLREEILPATIDHSQDTISDEASFFIEGQGRAFCMVLLILVNLGLLLLAAHESTSFTKESLSDLNTFNKWEQFFYDSEKYPFQDLKQLQIDKVP